MADVSRTLIECFAAVFPELPRHAIPTASVNTVEAWDSIASVTLLAVVEEEFAVRIDDMDLAELTSFPAVEAYLRGRVAA